MEKQMNPFCMKTMNPFDPFSNKILFHIFSLGKLFLLSYTEIQVLNQICIGIWTNLFYPPQLSRVSIWTSNIGENPQEYLTRQNFLDHCSRHFWIQKLLGISLRNLTQWNVLETCSQPSIVKGDSSGKMRAKVCSQNNFHCCIEASRTCTYVLGLFALY